MRGLADAAWRAAAYCLHPRVIALSLLPLVLVAGLALGLGYFYWEGAVAAVRSGFEQYALVDTLLGWLEGIGLRQLRSVLAPLLVVFAVTPVLVVVSLLVVAAMMTPAVLSLVAQRRFPTLERKRGGSGWVSALGALGFTVVAMLAMAVSIPLWFVPPLVLVVPPLIWGWLTYRVMSYDVLFEYASREERLAIVSRHRGALFAMGVVTGYLGAAPSLVWASGALFLALAPVLVPLAIWIYTLVFAFSALWFAHFGLSALAALRAERQAAAQSPPSPPPSLARHGPVADTPLLPLPPA